MINCTIIDNKTGEILTDNYNIDELKDKERKRKAIEKKQIEERFKQLQQEYLGNFVFFIFRNMDKLQEIFTDSELVKLIYIGTYVRSDGILKLDNNFSRINKKKLRELLKANKPTFDKFYNKLLESGIIKEEGETLHISLNLFYRGAETNYKKTMTYKLEDFSRVYIETTRRLYLDTPARSHSKLSIAFKLLPFVNWKYNVLCHNINEQDKDKINPLSIGDIISILGYDKTNITKFKKDFYNIKCDTYNMFLTVQADADYNNSIILVNPLIYYRGKDIDELDLLITMFGLKPKHNIK